jgi:hypothetical protein
VLRNRNLSKWCVAPLASVLRARVRPSATRHPSPFSSGTLGARPCALRRMLDARFVCCLIPTLKPIATPPRKEKARRREGGGGTYHLNHRNRPRTWVSGYTFWDLTSYPSGHVTRRLLVHLDDQETTVSRRGFIPRSYRCTHKFTPWGVKPSKSAPHMSARSYGAGFCITTIEGHHEISDEPSRTPGGDVIASRSIDTGAPISHPKWRRGVHISVHSIMLSIGSS